MSRWLLRFYPRHFRDRYGDELAEVVAHSDRPVRDAVNVIAHAADCEWRPS